MTKIAPILNKLNIWTLGLLCLICLHLLVNLNWVTSNNAPLPWDSANHLFISTAILEKIQSFKFLEIFKVSNYYPILVHTISAFLLLLTGIDIKTGQYLGSVYFVAVLLIIFLYIKKISNNFIAFFTTLLVSFSPIYFNQSRQLMLDIPSVGFLFVSLYFYEKSKRFRDLKSTLWFFASAAFLVMTKWTGLIYLVLPILIAIYDFFQNRQKKIQTKNIFLGGLLFGFIALPWYLANLSDVLYLGKIYSVDHSNPEGKNVWTLSNFRDYLNIFLRDQVTPIPGLVFLACLPAFLFMKNKVKWFVLGMIFINYFLFSLLGNKDSRFTMHLNVFSSFIVSYVLYMLTKANKFIGSMSIIFMVMYVSVYFLLLSMRPAFLENYKKPVDLPVLGNFNLFDFSNSLVKKADTRDWSMTELNRDMYKLSEGKPMKVVVVSEWEHFNPSNIRTYTHLSGLNDLQIVTADIVFLKERYNLDHFPTQDDLLSFLKDNDYLLIVEKDLGSPILLNGKALNQIIEYVYSQESFAHAGKKTFCRDLNEEIVSAQKELCIVESGEVLTTGSDVLINNEGLPKGLKEIRGYTQVECPWGCTFGVLNTFDVTKRINLQFIKIYTLPNGERVHLVKID